MHGATTVGAALLRAGELSLDAPPDLDASDWWMRHSFTVAALARREMRSGSWLVFEGLATIVDVWLNGVHLGRTDNMFVAWEAEVSGLLRAENELVLCARALRPMLRPQRPRARWKSRSSTRRNGAGCARRSSAAWRAPVRGSRPSGHGVP